MVARIVAAAWRAAGLSVDAWRLMQTVLHEEFSHFAQESCHETNRFLIQRGVLPDIDLRPFIRRSRAVATRGFGSTGPAASTGFNTSGRGAAEGHSEVADETRMMTRAGGLARGSDHAEAVLGRLNRLVGRQLPDFAVTSNNPPATSPRLKTAISEMQQSIARRLSGVGAQTIVGPVSTPALLEEINQRKIVLKQAATTPV